MSDNMYRNYGNGTINNLPTNVKSQKIIEINENNKPIQF